MKLNKKERGDFFLGIVILGFILFILLSGCKKTEPYEEIICLHCTDNRPVPEYLSEWDTCMERCQAISYAIEMHNWYVECEEVNQD